MTVEDAMREIEERMKSMKNNELLKEERMCDRAITITVAFNSMVDSVFMYKELGYSLDRMLRVVTTIWNEELEGAGGRMNGYQPNDEGLDVSNPPSSTGKYQDIIADYYKLVARWEILKGQIEHETEQANIGLIASTDKVYFPKRTNEAQYGDEMFHTGLLTILRRIKDIIARLEEK